MLKLTLGTERVDNDRGLGVSSSPNLIGGKDLTAE